MTTYHPALHSLRYRNNLDSWLLPLLETQVICSLLALSPASSILSTLMALAQPRNLIFILTYTQCDAFYVGETKNSLSSRMNGHCSISYNPENLLLSVTSTANLTNSLLIPDWMYTYFITYPPILIMSPATILNLPVNSLCPLDTALVLISGNLFYIFPPSPPLLPSSVPSSDGSCSKLSYDTIFTVCSQKDLCENQNLSIKFLYAFLVSWYLSSRDLVFLVYFFPFLFLFLYNILCVCKIQ